MLRSLTLLSLGLLLSLTAQAGETITGRVTLAPELANQAQPGDTVFIFARAVNGPRMPLAALRATVADLPLEFQLDDSMAMAPMARLSNFEQVSVIARISAHGGVQASSGDLEGESPAIRPGTTGVEIQIQRVLP